MSELQKSKYPILGAERNFSLLRGRLILQGKAELRNLISKKKCKEAVAPKLAYNILSNFILINIYYLDYLYDQFNMWGLVILYKLNIRMKIINFPNKFKLSSFQDVEFLLVLPPGHNSFFYYQKLPTEFNQHNCVCFILYFFEKFCFNG